MDVPKHTDHQHAAGGKGEAFLELCDRFVELAPLRVRHAEVEVSLREMRIQLQRGGCPYSLLISARALRAPSDAESPLDHYWSLLVVAARRRA